mgnify:CR=1 FL=1
MAYWCYLPKWAIGNYLPIQMNSPTINLPSGNSLHYRIGGVHTASHTTQPTSPTNDWWNSATSAPISNSRTNVLIALSVSKAHLGAVGKGVWS